MFLLFFIFCFGTALIVGLQIIKWLFLLLWRIGRLISAAVELIAEQGAGNDANQNR